jgi:5-formyltetrahydrofolate cyclo-ligase
MQYPEKIAHQIEQKVRPFARPDSHFHLDFSRFIPGFQGDEDAAARLAEHPVYQRSRRVFITPDNSLIPVRQNFLEEGRDIVLPTYGLHDGFIIISAAAIPMGHERFASWLDGAQHFGRSVSLEELRQGGVFDLIIAGAAAVDRAGRRFGMGCHYLDIEWGIFTEAGLVNSDTSVVAVVHDSQVSDQLVDPSDSHVHADVVLTPTQTLDIGIKSRPVALDWRLVDLELAKAPPLLELGRDR